MSKKKDKEEPLTIVDISQAPTEDLITELFSRFNQTLLVFERPGTLIGQYNNGIRYFASAASALGLTIYAQKELEIALLQQISNGKDV